MTTDDAGPKSEAGESVWSSLSSALRSAVLSLVVIGFAIFDVGFVLLSLTLGRNFSEGIQHLPLDLAAVAFSGLIIVSVFIVSVGSEGLTDRSLARLGDSWVLFTIPLTFDFLVDSFYGKPLLIALAAIVGIQYWKGRRNNSLGFVISIFACAIVAGDGLGHLRGMECLPTGLSGCPVKAVSDLYLLMMLLPLTYATVSARSERPSLLILALAAFLAVSVFVGFGFSG